ncbi:MAG: molybdate ABC transporter permease subunit [Litorilinea sp.]
MNYWEPTWLSLRVTLVATVAIFGLGLALALLLARTHIRGKLFIETLITLPLVLPPSVVGYFLLIALGRNNLLYAWLGWDILFTWQAAAVAATVVGLPLMVQASRAALEDADEEAENAARVDGATEWQIWRYVTIPMARRGILAGLILGSARALGEFGATLMVAGSIPGRTQTLPLAIYDAVQARRYDEANFMVLIMTTLAFAALWVVYRLNGLYTRPPRTRSSTLGSTGDTNADRDLFR